MRRPPCNASTKFTDDDPQVSSKVVDLKFTNTFIISISPVGTISQQYGRFLMPNEINASWGYVYTRE